MGKNGMMEKRGIKIERMKDKGLHSVRGSSDLFLLVVLRLYIRCFLKQVNRKHWKRIRHDTRIDLWESQHKEFISGTLKIVWSGTFPSVALTCSFYLSFLSPPIPHCRFSPVE